MKVVIAGATGFVATEVIRQALSMPAITSVIALARRSTALPKDAAPGSDASKFKSVVCADFGSYPESVKQELSGADACIWLLAVTPAKSKALKWADVEKICFDYPATGLKTLSQLPRGSASSPLRFVYISGSSAERDQTKKPWILGEYSLMRGRVESHVLDFAKQSNGAVEACVAKPGIINGPGRDGMLIRAAQAVASALIDVPNVKVAEIAATLLHEATSGITQETLVNEDLVRNGQKYLAEQTL